MVSRLICGLRSFLVAALGEVLLSREGSRAGFPALPLNLVSLAAQRARSL
jgi:hypothetical protein